MFATLISALALLGSPQPQNYFVSAEFPSVFDKEGAIMVTHYISPLETPKVSPKHEWKFNYITVGMVRAPTSESFNTRFRVFGQVERKDHNDVYQWSTRLLLRLWEYSYYELNIEHQPRFGRSVDVYMATTGDPGGEQLFDIDGDTLNDAGQPSPVNTIYIYQVQNIRTNFELARELAHEYGHAQLPTVGGFSAPESYAAGDVGERIFLTWMLKQLDAGKLSPEDTVFVDRDRLREYVKANVEPLVAEVASAGVDPAKLRKKDKQGYMHYVAVCTYASQILPPEIFSRSQLLIAKEPYEAETGILDAAEERRTWTLTIPPYLKGKSIWIPLVKGKVANATVVERKGKWAKIKPTKEPVTISNPEI